MTAISIIDYGAGNLKSVERALRYVGADAKICASASEIDNARAIVLPGVGSFGDAMKNIAGVKEAIVDKIKDGAPFIGICLGLQALFEGSDESPGARGLGVFEGNCVRLLGGALKVPQIGWNAVSLVSGDKILAGIPNDSYFYFAHSYYAEPRDSRIVRGVCSYGVGFPAVVSRDNVFACQFHPEKSGETGLRILKNFAGLVD